MGWVRWDNSPVTVTTDAKRRVVLPLAKPGDHFDLHQEIDGRMVLIPLVPVQTPNQVKLVSKHGYTVAVTSRPISHEETRRLLDQFP